MNALLSITFVDHLNSMVHILTQILQWVVLAFLLLAVVFFVMILASRVIKNAKERKKKTLLKKFSHLITRFIFEDNEDVYIEDQHMIAFVNHFNRHYLKKRFARAVLLELVVSLYEDISGKAAHNLKQLYYEFQLEGDSLKKLKNRRWFINAQGIRELTIMDVDVAYSAIFRFINHKNALVRMEAQLAVVKLRKFDALAFLEESRFPISEWQQLNLLNVLSRFDQQQLPDFTRWLDANNDSIVRFALNLISHFQLEELQRSVLGVLKHNNLKVRLTAVRVLGELDAASSLARLKRMYQTEGVLFKREVLKVASVIGIEKDLPFLEEALNEPDRSLKISAARSIGKICESGQNYLGKLYASAKDETVKAVLMHVIEEQAI